MKIRSKIATLIIALGVCSLNSFAQESDLPSDESYCKANIAFTSFKILGVNSTQYARCIEATNYLEKNKKVKLVKVDGIDFIDNGEDYDLVANDGIMTSKVLFTYAQDATTVPVGQYVVTRDNSVIHDGGFVHTSKLGSGGTAGKISVACDFYWENCSSWPPAYQSLCRSLTWPFSGHLVISNCRITWTSN